MLTDGTWTYTWQNGRELASMSKGSTTWNYTYDANGMRTQRSNGTTVYNYVYNGSQLAQMTVGSNTLKFAYDASGKPMMLTYNGTNYYYIVNLQGDVMGIVDSADTLVVYYTYDAWGKRIFITGSMARTLGMLNPLRYRGYVYDQETEYYYLQSRYYDPKIGRFINADGLVATGQGMLGNNMFAYCRNNPVKRKDATGTDDVCVTDFNEDNNPLNDLGNPSGGGGGGGGGLGVKSSYYTSQRVQAYDWKWQNSSYNQSSTSFSETAVSIPQEAKDILAHVDQKGCAPQGYKGGKIFQNDGRQGSQVLPSSGMPYREYDIYPHIKGVPRGTERIVVGVDNSVWYTDNHYATFIQMR